MNENVAKLFRELSSEEGGVNWPDSSKERTEIARKLLGVAIIESYDYWVARAEEIIDAGGEDFPPAFKEEKAIRNALSNISPELRPAIIQLVSIAVSGALFSVLTSIDQFPGGEIAINLEAYDLVEPVVLAPTDIELHDSFFDWMTEYSSRDSAA